MAKNSRKGTQMLLDTDRSVYFPRVLNFQVSHPAITPQGFLGATSAADNMPVEETFFSLKFYQGFPRSRDSTLGRQVMERAILALKLL